MTTYHDGAASPAAIRWPTSTWPQVDRQVGLATLLTIPSAVAIDAVWPGCRKELRKHAIGSMSTAYQSAGRSDVDHPISLGLQQALRLTRRYITEMVR